MKCEKGNALFLILIAVALFAALSYAVTQSGRSGGGVDKEDTMIKVAQTIQYMSSLTNAATRLTIIDGIDPTNITFETTPLSHKPCINGTGCLFTSEGGGAAWQNEVVGTTRYATTSWNFSVTDVGTTAADVLTYTYNLTQSECEQFNKGLGLSAPVAEDPDSTVPYNAYPGEHYACSDMIFGAGTNFVYYHVIAAR